MLNKIKFLNRKQTEKILNEQKGKDIFFNDKKRHITCGLEVEMYLFDRKTRGNLLNDDGIMEQILKNCPDVITRDYYSYQIEIRTGPHSSPQKLIKEFLDNYQKAKEVCHDFGQKILPLSQYAGAQNNGLHFHVRAVNGRTNNFYNELINSYPFVLSLASFFRDSPDGTNVISRRMMNSSHIGLPFFNERKFLNGGLSSSNNRYKDVVINKNTETDVDEHGVFFNKQRIKNVHTFELRLFDTPSNPKYFNNMINLLFKMYQHIDVRDNKSYIWDDMKKYQYLAETTRNEVLNTKHPFNYFFNDYCSNVVGRLCEFFSIKFLENSNPIKNDIYNWESYINNKKLGDYALRKLPRKDFGKKLELFLKERRRMERRRNVGMDVVTGMNFTGPERDMDSNENQRPTTASNSTSEDREESVAEDIPIFVADGEEFVG